MSCDFDFRFGRHFIYTWPDPRQSNNKKEKPQPSQFIFVCYFEGLQMARRTMINSQEIRRQIFEDDDILSSFTSEMDQGSR